MHVRTVAVGKDRLAHLTMIYGLRESVHGGQKGHQGAPACVRACVRELSSINDFLSLLKPGRL